MVLIILLARCLSLVKVEKRYKVLGLCNQYRDPQFCKKRENEVRYKRILSVNSPSIMLSCSSLRDSFYKNAQFLQPLVSSHTHSYDTNAKPIISCMKRNAFFKKFNRKKNIITCLKTQRVYHLKAYTLTFIE